MGGEFDRAGKFRRQRHQLHMPFSSFIEAIEDGEVRGKEMLGWLDAPPFMREKRTLEVNSHGPGGVPRAGEQARSGDEFCQAGDRAEGCFCQMRAPAPSRPLRFLGSGAEHEKMEAEN
ncbi:MAG: hypothetical protein ACLGPM_01505 [Acidobacteriota bacterium]